MEAVGFPGGAVVKNPPANAEDTGSSPGPGRSHIAAEQLSAPQLLSLRATITDLGQVPAQGLGHKRC